MKILVTGSTKFIKFNLSNFLFEKRFKVIALDNINDCYFSQLKKSNPKTNKKS
jgi:nucleoside-diphosphate-sugar epimerase